MADVNMQIYEDHLDLGRGLLCTCACQNSRAHGWHIKAVQMPIVLITSTKKLLLITPAHWKLIDANRVCISDAENLTWQVVTSSMPLQIFAEVSAVMDKLHLRRQADELLRNMNTLHSSEGVKNENSITGN